MIKRLRQIHETRRLNRSLGRLRGQVPPHPQHDDWWVTIRLVAEPGRFADLWARIREALMPLATDDEARDALNQRPDERADSLRVVDVNLSHRGGSPLEAYVFCYAVLLDRLGTMPPVEAIWIEPRLAGQDRPSGRPPLTPHQQRVEAGA